MLFKEDLFGMLEAILFVSNEPLSREKLQEALSISPLEMSEVLEEYMEILNLPGRGIELIEAGGGYKLQTKKTYWNQVSGIVRPQGGQLSRAALETLSIIAYKQPITRSEVEEIRGVNADSMIYRLLEKELIQEVGRKNVPGHPNLYGTTNTFLLQLGINSLEELPPLQDLQEEDLTQEELDYHNEGLVVDILRKEN